MVEKNDSDWPTNECNMPDLSDLNSQKMLIHSMFKMFGGGGPKDPVASSMSMNFVRLTDHLIYEYENARQQINVFIAEGSQGNFSAYHRAICHMETAVTTMLRAIRIAQRVRNWDHEPKVPVPKQTAVLRDTVEKKVRLVRDAVEHIYDQLIKGTRKDGVPACLIMRINHFESEGYKIQYADFAGWIRQLDPIAQALAIYKEP